MWPPKIPNDEHGRSETASERDRRQRADSPLRDDEPRTKTAEEEDERDAAELEEKAAEEDLVRVFTEMRRGALRATLCCPADP